MSNYHETSDEEFEAALEGAVQARVDSTIRKMARGDVGMLSEVIDDDDGHDCLMDILKIVAQVVDEWPRTRPWQAQTMGHLQTLLREMIAKQVRAHVSPDDAWSQIGDARDQAAIDRRGMSTNPATYAARGEAV